MKLTQLSKTKDKLNLSFLLEGVVPSFANALRRAAMDEVPTMAIEDVEFRKNNSGLYDEMLAHRIGLIPLKTDLKSYELPERCSCKGEGCARCQLKLTLVAKGPKTAYAFDIESKDPKVIPVQPKVPVVKLLKGHEIEAEFTAILGRGKEHAKWSPGLIYFRNSPQIEVSKLCNDCAKCIEACPKNIFELKNNKLHINPDKIMECTLCEACQDVCPKKAVTVSSKENNFTFFVESWGQLSSKEIMLKSAEVLKEKLDDFSEKLKSM